MPLDPLTINSVLFPSMVSSGMLGTGVAQFSYALSCGLSEYFLLGVRVQTFDSGSAGVGVGNGPPGSVVILPVSIGSIMPGVMISAGMKGVAIPMLTLAFSESVPLILMQSTVTTSSPLVGTGAGVGTLVPTGAYPYIIRGFKSNGMNGPSSDVLALAIGEALDASLPTSIVKVAISGSASPSPSTGLGIGGLF